MNNLPRNVILDLLPAYIAGEASAETRALIEEYAQQDQQIARLIRSGAGDLPPVASSPPANAEIVAVKRVRKRLRRQGWFLGFAIFFTLITVSYQWGDAGIRWTITDFPLLAALHAAIGVVFWVLYFKSRARLKAGV